MKSLRTAVSALLLLSFLAGCASEMSPRAWADQPERERIPDTGY